MSYGCYKEVGGGGDRRTQKDTPPHSPLANYLLLTNTNAHMAPKFRERTGESIDDSTIPPCSLAKFDTIQIFVYYQYGRRCMCN